MSEKKADMTIRSVKKTIWSRFRKLSLKKGFPMATMLEALLDKYENKK